MLEEKAEKVAATETMKTMKAFCHPVYILYGIGSPFSSPASLSIRSGGCELPSSLASCCVAMIVSFLTGCHCKMRDRKTGWTLGLIYTGAKKNK